MEESIEEVSSTAGGSPTCVSLKTVLETVRHNVYYGKPPLEYGVAADPWGTVKFRPGDVMALAAPPGMGKTALVTQWSVDALRLHPEARLLTVNVEMRPDVILERQVSRLSGVPYADIAGRVSTLGRSHVIDPALATLDSIGERMFFMSPPFSITRVLETAMRVESTILVLDYVQRIECCEGATDARSRLNSLMHEVRGIANAGVCVVLISAVSRTPSKKGGGYNKEEIGMGSFRESSEIEYGVDDAFVLVEEEDPETTSGSRILNLRHVKSRNHQRVDLRLLFEGVTQRFRLAPPKADPSLFVVPEVSPKAKREGVGRPGFNVCDPFLEGLGEGR